MAEYGTIIIGQNTWQVTYLDDPIAMHQGLSGVQSLEPGSSVLFNLGAPTTIQVTTEEMLFALDIVFFDSNFLVTEVLSNVQPGLLLSSAFIAQYFLEINAGEAVAANINIGDQAAINITSSPVPYSPSSHLMAVLQWQALMLPAIVMAPAIINAATGAFKAVKGKED